MLMDPLRAELQGIVDGAFRLAQNQSWLRGGAVAVPLPPRSHVEVAMLGRVVCDCGVSFIWPSEANTHYEQAHKPKPSHLTMLRRRIRWAWRLRSLKPFYSNC